MKHRMDRGLRCAGSLAARTARVIRVTEPEEGFYSLEVDLGRGPERAVGFRHLSGAITAGDTVLVNTTAVRLGLGSGGVHFVISGNRPPKGLAGPGHIIKLRYTPLQHRVFAVEEQASPYHEIFKHRSTLQGMPVLVGELHSMLEPACYGVKAAVPGGRPPRLAYVMTDSAALPAQLSDTVRRLKRAGVIQACISCGQAFGGDFDAINVFSALLCARYVVMADLALVFPGPGIVGTGTPLGFGGMEQVFLLHAALSLGGRPVMVPRLSLADSRRRHFGISHHTTTVLSDPLLPPVDVVVPYLPDRTLIASLVSSLQSPGPWGQYRPYASHQEGRSSRSRHRIHIIDGGAGIRLARRAEAELKSMGRGYREDPVFFLACSAAGMYAGRLARSPRPARLEQSGKEVENSSEDFLC